MLKKILAALLVVTMVVTVFTGCGSDKEEDSDTKKEKTIGFAVSTLGNEFFVQMKEAAEKKAEAVGVKLIVLDAQDSSETQATQIEDLITQDVDLLIINPVDSDAIGTSVIAANNEKIPVITVTRPSNSGKVEQHLDIDNKEAGALDAEQLIKDLSGKGKVAILEGISGAPSAVDRQAGFKEKLEADAPDIEIVASLTADYDREKGATVTEDILQANPELDAIYTHNDEMALGAVRSVVAANRIDDIKIYGIDAVPDAIKAVKEGEMAATVQQQPDLQIETAIDNAIKLLDGDTIEALINIPLKLITKENAQ